MPYTVRQGACPGGFRVTAGAAFLCGAGRASAIPAVIDFSVIFARMKRYRFGTTVRARCKDHAPTNPCLCSTVLTACKLVFGSVMLLHSDGSPQKGGGAVHGLAIQGNIIF